MARICIVTAGHLSTCPRMLKAADAFAGGDVLAALLQPAQPRHSRFVRRDDEFPADVVRDFVLAAELHHLPDSRDGQTRLVRARPVMKSAMQHAAVMGALVAAHGHFLLEEEDFGVGRALQQPPGRREADESAANDGEIIRCHASRR